MKKIISIFLTSLFLFNTVVFGVDGRPQISDFSTPQDQIFDYSKKIFESDCNCWTLRERHEISKAISGVFAGLAISAISARAGINTILKAKEKIKNIKAKVGKKAPDPKKPYFNNPEMDEAKRLANESTIDFMETSGKRVSGKDDFGSIRMSRKELNDLEKELNEMDIGLIKKGDKILGPNLDTRGGFRFYEDGSGSADVILRKGVRD